MTAVPPRPWPAGWSVVGAVTHRARGRGLLGRTGLAGREGLWLPVRSVHTFGMRFALDLVWLDREGAVVRLDTGVGRRRCRTCRAARGGVVEVAAGEGPALAVAIGTLDSVATDQASHRSDAAPPR